MTQHQIDSNTLRAELRALPRGSLLLIAERAVELVSQDQLGALLADVVQINVDPTEARSDDSATIVGTSLLDEVHTFHDAAVNGDFYEHVEINSKGRREQSEGTDGFIAEFDRLVRRCIRAVAQEMHSEARSSFELLFGLLRHIDKGNDDMLAFSDDGSSLDVGVNWRVVLPAYFECLAETEASSPEEFARAVDEAIAEFAKNDRPRYMDAAYTVASDVQRIAMTSR